MPNTPIRPGGPIDDAELDQRRSASRTLSEALSASGIRSLCDVGRTPQNPAVTLVLLPNRWVPVAVLDDAELPDQAAATVLRHGLRSISVTADVAVEAVGSEPATRIKLATSGDATRLAQWLMTILLPPQAAAQRLRAALGNLGIGAEGIRAAGANIHVGGLDADDAVVLGHFLHDLLGLTSDPDGDWRTVEELASRTGAILSAATGHVAMVSPDPACNTCERSRPHRLQVSDLTLSATLRLAAALEEVGEFQSMQQS